MSIAREHSGHGCGNPAEYTEKTARELAAFCNRKHATYGACIHGDRLHVWYGRGVSSLRDGPAMSASTSIPMSRLTFWWRNAVSDALRHCRTSLLEG